MVKGRCFGGTCGAEEGGRCCRACGFLLFPKTLLVLGSRVRSFSSSCSEHNSRQCLLTGTYWPQLALDSARRNVKYPQKAGLSQWGKEQEHASLLGFCFFLHLNPTSLPRKVRILGSLRWEKPSQMEPPALPGPSLTPVPKCHIPPVSNPPGDGELLSGGNKTFPSPTALSAAHSRAQSLELAGKPRWLRTIWGASCRILLRNVCTVQLVPARPTAPAAGPSSRSSYNSETFPDKWKQSVLTQMEKKTLW